MSIIHGLDNRQSYCTKLIWRNIGQYQGHKPWFCWPESQLLVASLDAFSSEVKSSGSKVTWTKTKISDFRGLLSLVQTKVHYMETVDISVLSRHNCSTTKQHSKFVDSQFTIAKLQNSKNFIHRLLWDTQETLVPICICIVLQLLFNNYSALWPDNLHLASNKLGVVSFLLFKIGTWKSITCIK